MDYIEELRNPIWESLNGHHKRFAVGTENVAHYPFDVTFGVGLKYNSDDELSELADMVEPGLTVGIFGKSSHDTPQWITIFSGSGRQMVCQERIPIPEHIVEILTLDTEDVPDMLALIKLTEPGPYLQRTIEMGPYFGIRDQGQLVAMAGGRMWTPHYREISAVCTHPGYRGKGYAGLLISILVNHYFDAGFTPFLHVSPDNTGAIRLYKQLGFVDNHDINILLVQRANDV